MTVTLTDLEAENEAARTRNKDRELRLLIPKQREESECPKD